MALYILAITAVFGHRAVGRAEVFGKRHRGHEAPHRSTVNRIINDRLRWRRLRLQQGWRRCGRLDQPGRSHLNRHRASRARTVHSAADGYARTNDGPARLQVPNVQCGVAFGAVVYDDHLVYHDYSANVSSERNETVRV